MRDFQEIPSKEALSIFLIRDISNLNENLLKELQKKLLINDWTVSIERIFKGGKQAYILVGPKEIVSELPSLNLLELEDYTAQITSIVLWEMTVKNHTKFDLIHNLPTLSENEQFWLQILLKSQKGKVLFQAQIRAGVISNRAKELSENLNHISGNQLIKLPRPITSQEMFNLYKARIFYRTNKEKLNLTASEVAELLLG